MLESCFPSTVDCAFANFFRTFAVSNYAFVYTSTSDFELGAKFESGVETEILVRVGLELPLDQNSFCETPLRCGR